MHSHDGKNGSSASLGTQLRVPCETGLIRRRAVLVRARPLLRARRPPPPNEVIFGRRPGSRSLYRGVIYPAVMRVSALVEVVPPLRPVQWVCRSSISRCGARQAPQPDGSRRHTATHLPPRVVAWVVRMSHFAQRIHHSKRVIDPANPPLFRKTAIANGTRRRPVLKAGIIPIYGRMLVPPLFLRGGRRIDANARATALRGAGFDRRPGEIPARNWRWR